MADNTTPGTISGARLCELTGLTDRRHRQLAAEGYFTPPINGQYEATASIRGVLRYYRELNQKRGVTLSQKRERKLDNENRLLEIEIARLDEQLIEIQEMAGRLTPALAAMRARILSSSLPEEERDALLDDLGRLLDDGIKRTVSKSGAPATAAVATAAASDSLPVGG